MSRLSRRRVSVPTENDRWRRSHSCRLAGVRLGQPNELYAFHFADSSNAPLDRGLDVPVEGLSPGCLFLLSGALGGVLPIEFGADQFNIAGAHRLPIEEWQRISALVGERCHQNPAQQLQ